MRIILLIRAMTVRNGLCNAYHFINPSPDRKGGAV